MKNKYMIDNIQNRLRMKIWDLLGIERIGIAVLGDLVWTLAIYFVSATDTLQDALLKAW